MITRSKNEALKNLGLRVYSNQAKVENIVDIVKTEQQAKDEKEIVEIINKTFGHGTPSPENLHLFNNLLVETAEIIAEPKVDYILNLVADFKTAPSGTIVQYKIPKTVKPKFLYTAKGTGVDLVRISPNETTKIATQESITYGAYYEITTFQADPVKAFYDAVNALAQAKVDLYFDKIFDILAVAKTNGEIPNANMASGANTSLSDFQKVEQTMIRLTNGRPLFIADMALIDHYADLIPSTQTNLLTDDLRILLREELIPTKISKSTALAFPNSWIDEANSKVRFNTKEGFMFPGGISGKKAFAITEFGTKRQYSAIDPETEQVNLKIVFDVDITLLNGRYLGLITDTSITV